MKNLAAATVLVLAAGLFAAPPAARATSVSGQFDVVINLTAACEIASLPIAVFDYAGGQSAAATFSSAFNIRCTNGLIISSIDLDRTTVTDSATSLTYTLALSNVPTAGTGAVQTITLNGTMAAGQGGTCTSATCTNAASINKRRTLTITY